MKEGDVRTLVRHRLEQAQTALDDAKFLLTGRRSPQSIVNRAYYGCFTRFLHCCSRLDRSHRDTWA